ncbi:MAG: winged helix-turn-helix domain-containing protein, partial [Candidatus Hermodarchaeota archaeon]|nr:winged helix-turn-helix domain-containing protein [Candidatus Hermodarchaeota archaeon]
MDKSILWELAVNCRCSMQAIADMLDLSVNAVKKRIARLTDVGIIVGYQLYPSLAMMEAETSLAILKFDDPSTGDARLEAVGVHPLIYAG